jgi:hypothetical protein
MKANDSLGLGLYSMVEAVRLLKTPRRTLERWMEGYVRELRGGTRFYSPVIEWENGSALTFGDLVELMYVRGFREGGVPLDEIRKAASKYRAEWSTLYPLATKRFATNGQRLLLEEGGVWKQALTGQRQFFFDELGKKLIHVGDLTSEWRPLGNDRQVVLNPERSFGKPIDTLSGVHTFQLSQALKAGDSAAKIAWWYDTTEDAVLDAAKFEDDFQITPRVRAVTA